MTSYEPEAVPVTAEADPPEAVEPTDEAVEPTDEAVEPTPRSFGPLLSNVALALASLAGVELLLTIVLGLSVDVDRLSRVARIGYAFLTQLEKSPLGLLLVIAAIAAAAAARLSTPGSSSDGRSGLAAGLILGFSIVLGIGTVLAVIARFNVADLAASQPVDGVTRRVLAIFVLRNIGAAAIAFITASTAVRTRPRV